PIPSPKSIPKQTPSSATPRKITYCPDARVRDTPNQHKNKAEKEPPPNVNPDSLLLQELLPHDREPSPSAKSGQSCPCGRSGRWCARHRNTSGHTCFSLPR